MLAGTVTPYRQTLNVISFAAWSEEKHRIMSVVGCARALRCLNTKSATSDGVVMHFSTRSRAPAYFAARCPTGSYAKYWSSFQIIPVMAGVSITVWAHAQSHTSVSSPMQEWMTWHCPSHFSQAEQQCCVLLYHQHIHQCLTLDCASPPRTPPTHTHTPTTRSKVTVTVSRRILTLPPCLRPIFMLENSRATSLC